VRFGAISAFGVLTALLLSFSLLPLLLCAVRGERRALRAGPDRWSAVLERSVWIAHTHRVAILGVGSALLVLFTACWLSLLQVDTDWLESWGDRSDRTRAIRFLEERMGRLKTIELCLTLPANRSIDEPETLAAVERLELSISRVGELAGTTSVLDVVARANRLLHGDDPAFERAPATPGATAEILELLSLDDESVLRPWLSLDRSRLRISIEAREFAHQQGKRVVAAVKDVAAAVLPAGWQASLSGEIPITVDWVEDVQATQLQGFPTAVLTVYLLIAVFLRSAPLALAALLPTLLPIVVVLGSMGLLGLDLDVGRAMIGSVVIGIGVDDAIHLLSQHRLRRRAGMPAREAMASAMRHSGRAIVTNSLALSLGFLTLMSSAWQSISSFGFFAALSILGALASTLFVVPALVFAFTRSADA
jgi:predicted RND superfamily exporter protein